MVKNSNTGCSCCGSLAERMKEANGGSYRQYDQILSELIVLERQLVFLCHLKDNSLAHG